MSDAISDLDRTSPRFRHHAAHPEVSFLDYLESRMVEHAQSYARRKLVYLDTKFWIKLCNAALNQPKALPEDHLLLAKARESVAQGRAVFPFSTPLWFETFHQADPQTRLATARLIDELSLRLTCLPESERIATELGLLVRAFVFRKPIGQPAEDLIWAVPFCGLGIPFVESDAWTEPDAATIHKTLLDQHWDEGFARIVAGAEDLSAKAKAAMAEGASEMNSFRSTLAPADTFVEEHAREFAGALRSKRDLIGQVIAVESYRNFGTALPWTAEVYADATRKFSAKIFEAFVDGGLGNALPSLEIPTALHAAMGRNPARKYKDNDYHDVAHATLALPYCDCFATERSLAHLVVGELKFDARFGCTVVTSSQNLTQYLDRLSSPT